MTTELVDRARRGDHAAFEQLAAASVDRLFALATRILRDHAAAEDAVQEALLRAWRDLRALRDPGRWEAWLYRLLLNACRDEQRRRRRRPVALFTNIVNTAAASNDIDAIARRDELERGLNRLTVDHRMALAMHYYLDLRAGEIADLLGVPEGTVVSRLHYGSRALRAAVEADLRGAVTTGVVE